MRLSEARDFWRSRGVPEEALDDLWVLAEAARYNDAFAEENADADTNALVAFLRDRGWHEEAVTYIAEQRALRVDLMARGGEAGLREFARTMDPAVVRGSSQATQLHLMMAWTDGFANGLVATELKAKR